MGGLRRSRGRLIGVGVAVALASLLTVGAAAEAETATPVTSCGQTVATDAILTRDLVCTGDAIVSMAGITLDLAGHTIRSSTGSGRGIVVDGPAGTTITVHGPGTIRGFGTGIEAHRRSNEGSISGYRHHLVVDGGLKLLDNVVAIGTQRVQTDATGITVRGTNGIGMGCPSSMTCDSAGQINVDRSTFTVSGTLFDPQMDGRVWVTNSRLHGGSAFGIHNTGLAFSDSVLQGVQLGCSEGGISISRSRLIDTVVGGGSYCTLRIQDNTIRSRAGGTGLGLGSNGNWSHPTIARNSFSGWSTAVAIGAFSPNVDIIDNHFDGNGIGIDAMCPRSGGSSSSGTIDHNSLVRNQGDAIRLTCGTWTVGSNRMIRNGGVGLAVGPPSPWLAVTDAGGNVANGNAEPQCTGVVCLPR